ncbi:heterokaryon incompatibility protein-domain-containing protein [Xylogone sp. PMI_703]|nr:heterokaryon incompatibility protein-domain-containing protein [Xylogone sp. PMI_703]
MPNLCALCANILSSWRLVLEDEYSARLAHHPTVFSLQASARSCPLCAQFLHNISSRGELSELVDATIDLLNQGIVPVPGWIQVSSFGRLISTGQKSLRDCWLVELRFRAKPSSREEDERWLYENDTSDEAEEAEEDQKSLDIERGNWVGGSSSEFACKVVFIPAVTESSLVDRIPRNSRDALGLAKLWYDRCSASHVGCRLGQSSIPTRLIKLENDSIRLCLAAEIQDYPRYATLSHCWGTIKLLKLTRANWEWFREGLPLSMLCQTFQDAIYVARALDLQYIWIDSLCIIQDDLDDWEKESKLMSSVYGCSSINIAATSATNGNGGCFFERDPNHVWRHQFPVVFEGVERIYQSVDDGIFDACVFSTPLARRAWAIQERILAPRTLFFSSSQLFWECNGLNACEIFPEIFPATLSYGDFYLQKQPLSRALWDKIVRLYSSCDLTFPEDKLIAISGLARHIQQREKNTYLAGLWKSDLEAQLCWKSRTRAARPLHNRAPSWSWASVDSTVTYGPRHKQRLWIQVVDVSLQPSDPFSKTLSGSLCIRYLCLIPGSIHRVDIFAGISIKIDSKIIQFKTNLDYLEIPTSEVYLLPIMDTIDPDLARGLLLQRTGSDLQKYQRIGHFEKPSKEFIEVLKLPSCINKPSISDRVDSGWSKDECIYIV